MLDEDGRPLAGSRVHLYRNVSYPGQGGRSFGNQVAVLDEIRADGSYAFDALIPGATYNTQAEAKGFAKASGQHITIKAGQPVRLEDFRLPAAVRELKGVVVDAAGRPAAGISVNYDRDGRTQATYAPDGATWFQESDSLGRFHLTGLPKGPIRLQAYRRPDGANRHVRGMQYLDVPPGQPEVRIEIRDRNDRLRGID